MAAEQGHIWVEGTALYFIDTTGTKKGATGTSTGNSGAPGYMWISGDYIYYTDQNGDERYLNNINMPGGAGVAGYQWLETTRDYIRYVGAAGAVTEWYHSDHSNHHTNHSNHAASHSNYTTWMCHKNTYSASTPHSNTLHHADYADTL
jgi:hypothetical protein